MKRFVLSIAAALSLLAAANSAFAQVSCDCSIGCGGNGACNPGMQKWAFWARTNSCAPTCDVDEARWQKFWHDYYCALGSYYKRLDRLDWVIYYKMHGHIAGGGCAQGGCMQGNCMPMGPGCSGCYYPKPQYAPVVVQPTMNWGVCPTNCCQPAGCANGCCAQGGGWGCNWPK